MYFIVVSRQRSCFGSTGVNKKKSLDMRSENRTKIPFNRSEKTLYFSRGLLGFSVLLHWRRRVVPNYISDSRHATSLLTQNGAFQSACSLPLVIRALARQPIRFHRRSTSDQSLWHINIFPPASVLVHLFNIAKGAAASTIPLSR